mmetsp:Transcript_3692/g.10641  ORF Transcript_3692/g.10641 Transcript_3692/m.10641 type:complete len:413 (-) Transcript_3692:125-1363(-)
MLNHAQVREVLPVQRMYEDAKDAAIWRIQEIEANGGTDLSGGLLAGIGQLANDARFSNYEMDEDPRRVVRAVLLLTDGIANRGIVDEQGIRRAMEAALAESEEPIRVFTFGYGSNHDGQLLSSIADAGSGRYKFIEYDEDLPAAFGGILGGLMATYCIDVEVTLYLSPYAAIDVSAGSLGDLPVRTQTASEASIWIDVGDMFAEERKDIVVKLSAPAIPSKEDSVVLLTASVRHYDSRISQEISQAATLDVERPEKVPGDMKPVPLVRLEALRLRSSKKIKEAKEAVDEGCTLTEEQMMQYSLAGAPAAAPDWDCDPLGKGRDILNDMLEEIKSERYATEAQGADQEVLEGYSALQIDVESVLDGFRDQSAYESRGSLQAAMFSGGGSSVGAAPLPGYILEAADKVCVQGDA